MDTFLKIVTSCFFSAKVTHLFLYFLSHPYVSEFSDFLNNYSSKIEETMCAIIFYLSLL